MKEVSITTRQLNIYYNIDMLSAEAISTEINKEYGVTTTPEEVVGLLKEREIVKRNCRRTTKVKDYVFVNPELANQTEISFNETVGVDNRKTSVVIED